MAHYILLVFWNCMGHFPWVEEMQGRNVDQQCRSWSGTSSIVASSRSANSIMSLSSWASSNGPSLAGTSSAVPLWSRANAIVDIIGCPIAAAWGWVSLNILSQPMPSNNDGFQFALLFSKNAFNGISFLLTTISAISLAMWNTGNHLSYRTVLQVDILVHASYLTNIVALLVVLITFVMFRIPCSTSLVSFHKQHSLPSNPPGLIECGEDNKLSEYFSEEKFAPSLCFMQLNYEAWMSAARLDLCLKGPYNRSSFLVFIAPAELLSLYLMEWNYPLLVCSDNIHNLQSKFQLK